MQDFKLRGQSLTELAVLIAAISAAILGMQLYLQRSLQARYKGGMDYFFSNLQGSGVSINRQYEPYYWGANRSVTKSANTLQGYPNFSENTSANQSGWYSTGPAQ